MTIETQITNEIIQTEPLASELTVKEFNKINRMPQNKNVQMINDFYEKFYSLRNLGFKAIFLVLAFTITVVAAFTLVVKFYDNSLNFIGNSWIFIVYIPVLILYHNLLNKHEKNILENYNSVYQTNFDTIYKTKEDWLKRNFGGESSANDLINKFEEWRKYTDAYPSSYHFRWGKYIYASDAKARIMGLTTALLALIGILLFNLFKITDAQVIIEQLVTNFIYIFLLFPFVILPVFLMLVFSRDLIKILYYFVFNFFYRDKFSEDKYKKLMAFLVSKMQIN